MAKQKEKPVVDNETGKIKVKTKPKKSLAKTEDTVAKVDLSKESKVEETETVTKVDLREKPENETKEEVAAETTEDNTDESGVVELVEDASATQEQEEVQQEEKTQEDPVVEEVVNEEVEELETEALDAITKAEETGEPLPENIQKLVDFINETGGSLEDYVSINKDYSEMDNQTLLHEYYKQTKPHLSSEEIDFLMEDTFAYDEEENTEKEIKRKKLAMKEQVASAKQHLESVKSKYYEEIKAGSKLTPEQQKAIDFFNRYNEQSESNEKMQQAFKLKSDKVFNDKFKGFEYNVGEKKFRFNIKDVEKVKNTQSDINNFIGKFLNKDNSMKDAAGYHKGLFTAMNPDRVANHFYEQGRADAIKESIAKSKNVSMDPRQSHVENLNTSGFKVRALDNDDSVYKFRIKNRN
tara:strand:- start:1003 stop:2232 length:1230 start_codon:yes stop_codon:yes gene_type:complete